MKKALIALAVVAFVAAGAAQSASGDSAEDLKQPNLDINKSEDKKYQAYEVNSSNSPRDVPEDMEQEVSAKFDARLNVAINTVSTLVEIAPNDETREGLQDALEQLRDVQDETSDNDETKLPEESGEEESDQENESDELGRDTEEGPGARGPSQNENRPGFVNRMLGGLFG